jgi:hypothetical protein
VSEGSERDVRRPVTAGAPRRTAARRGRLPGAAIAIVAVALIMAGGLWYVTRSRLDNATSRLDAARSAATAAATAPAARTAAPTADGPTRYARQLAALVSDVGARNGLTLATRVELIPSAGGDAQAEADIAAYRQAVTGAALAIGLVDQPTVDAWKAAGPDGQAKALQAWAAVVRGLLPKADVEIAVVGGAGPVARASLPPGAENVTVTLP